MNSLSEDQVNRMANYFVNGVTCVQNRREVIKEVWLGDPDTAGMDFQSYYRLASYAFKCGYLLSQELEKMDK